MVFQSHKAQTVLLLQRRSLAALAEFSSHTRELKVESTKQSIFFSLICFCKLVLLKLVVVVVVVVGVLVIFSKNLSNLSNQTSGGCISITLLNFILSKPKAKNRHNVCGYGSLMEEGKRFENESVLRCSCFVHHRLKSIFLARSRTDCLLHSGV